VILSPACGLRGSTFPRRTLSKVALQAATDPHDFTLAVKQLGLEVEEDLLNRNVISPPPRRGRDRRDLHVREFGMLNHPDYTW